MKQPIILDKTKPASLTPKRVWEAYLKNKPPKIIDRISPSQLGKCHRAHYYKIKHIEPTMELGIGALANFEMGFVWERMLKEALDLQGIQYSFQDQWYDPELNMSGSSDFVIGDMDDEAYMWDSKTVHSKWFKYRMAKRRSGIYDPWLEDYSYLIQQGAYLLMAKRQGKKVKQSTLAFISKDDGYIGDELIVTLTYKLEKEVMTRNKTLNKYLKADIVPPCTCEGWQVGYCDFGNPNTMEPNRSKKMVSTECCGDPEDLEAWRTEYINKKTLDRQ